MNVAAIFQNKVRYFMQMLAGVVAESSALGDIYWKSDMGTALAGITEVDPATVSSKLTKNQITLSVSLFERVDTFANSGASVAGDHLATAISLMNGNTARSSVLTAATENYGERAKSVATILNQMYVLSEEILAFYFANQISDVVAVISDYRVLFGATAQKEEIVEAMVAVEQFKKMMNNEAYTTGNYYGIAMEWAAFSQLSES